MDIGNTNRCIECINGVAGYGNNYSHKYGYICRECYFNMSKDERKFKREVMWREEEKKRLSKIDARREECLNLIEITYFRPDEPPYDEERRRLVEDKYEKEFNIVLRTWHPERFLNGGGDQFNTYHR